MSDAEDFVHNWQYKTLEFVSMQELGSDVNLYALVFGESVLNDAVCFLLLSSACKNSQYLYLWLTYLSPCLERTDGNFSLQVCFWLWYDLFFFKPCVSCLCMCFSSGQCHQSEVMQQSARTFLWWFSSSLKPLLVQCHQVALLLQIRLPPKVYEIVSLTIVCYEFWHFTAAIFSSGKFLFFTIFLTIYGLMSCWN